MTNKTSPIINVSELTELHNTEQLIIVHAGSGAETKEYYHQYHLESALYVDLDTDLSNIKDDASKGGRHPLPTPEQFSETLNKLGINENSQVVIYDTNSGANSAARFWWMLRSAGHQKAQVLNGGQQEAERMGFPMSSMVDRIFESGSFRMNEWKFPQANIDEVEEASKSQERIIIDVRSKERYKGIEEPIDLIAGHIPTAISIPLSENLDKNGLFKSPEELRSIYKPVLKDTDEKGHIIHCGSGVTACHTILAMAYAAMKIPKLYVGSWSEWSRNNKEMITK